MIATLLRVVVSILYGYYAYELVLCILASSMPTVAS